MTPSEASKALQASEPSELLIPITVGSIAPVRLHGQTRNSSGRSASAAATLASRQCRVDLATAKVRLARLEVQAAEARLEEIEASHDLARSKRRSTVSPSTIKVEIVATNLHPTPTQRELMQVICAEDIGRFEDTCIKDGWPPRARDVLARCVQGHSRTLKGGLSDDAIHPKYAADAAKTDQLLLHYTSDKLPYPILESGYIVPGGARKIVPTCLCPTIAFPTSASSPTTLRSE